MTNLTIEAEHLSKIYGKTIALEDVDFAVEKGEILGFLGPNGAGKTTTMRILSGYLPATGGTARIAGFDVHEKSMEVRRRIGYLPEHPPLYPDMTVEGFLDFVARIKGISAGERHDKVNGAIKRCQLTQKRREAIRKLSKGFRQRVGIAQAIVHDPPAIILDEPTVGLDPRQIIEGRNLIKSLAGEQTIILSTHILPEASMTCDRVTIIDRGKVIATNDPKNLMNQLSSSPGYEIEAIGDVTSLQPILSQLSGVMRVDITDDDRASGRSFIKVVTASGGEIGTEIAKIIVDRGLGLAEMRRTRPSLEDVFLQLTTKDIVIKEEI
jgi:ABC-2 type transport system ATP-binding protein